MSPCQKDTAHQIEKLFYGLISAVPEADPDRRSDFANSSPLKSSDMPSLLNIPKGHKFNPRCPNADQLCETKKPELVPS
ncbi:hypothetical protein AN643_02950 [Candidatus Epulonipiscioides saccharophilum]|nr:hypothetical protein AN643_02950 [Epulopiscium sp. SCG-B10WGA-EpuloB]